MDIEEITVTVLLSIMMLAWIGLAFWCGRYAMRGGYKKEAYACNGFGLVGVLVFVAGVWLAFF